MGTSTHVKSDLGFPGRIWEISSLLRVAGFDADGPPLAEAFCMLALLDKHICGKRVTSAWFLVENLENSNLSVLSFFRPPPPPPQPTVTYPPPPDKSESPSA